MKTREEALASVDQRDVAAAMSDDIKTKWKHFDRGVVVRLLPAVATAVHMSLAADTLIVVSASTTRSKVVERWRMAIDLVAEMGAAGWPVMRIAETLAHALRARLDGHPFNPLDDLRETWVPEASTEFAWRG
jgi:hypothetical protein